MAPPDLISQLLYGLISGALTAVLVWISRKMLLRLKKVNRVLQKKVDIDAGQGYH
jgi:hypothetical protein